MVEYNVSDIINVSNERILFKDGYVLKFEECKKGWEIEKGISANDNLCIASRNIVENVPYYLFYCNGNKIKLVFKFKGFLKKRRVEKHFLNIQMLLNNFGYSTYDES